MNQKKDTPEIAKLRRSIEEARQLADTLSKTLHIALCDHNDIHIGDVVVVGDETYKANSLIGKKLIVSKIRFNSSTIWLTGKPQKKDGSFSNAVRDIYENWEKA